MNDTRVGFVGLGNMGEGMATNLVKAGFDVSVRDVLPGAIDRLERLGATRTSSNAELGARSDVVCVAVFNEQQVIDVCFGTVDQPGVLAGLPGGGRLVVHSTVSPALCRRLADEAAVKNVHVLDAAMTGGSNAAANDGTLTFFVGGDPAALGAIRPVLGAMATNVFHVGGVGSGVLAKVVSNFLSISNLMLVREALRLGRAFGLDDGQLLEMIETGRVGASWVSANWSVIRDLEDHRTVGGGLAAITSKDLELTALLSEESNTEMPILDRILREAIPHLAAHGLDG